MLIIKEIQPYLHFLQVKKLQNAMKVTQLLDPLSQKKDFLSTDSSKTLHHNIASHTTPSVLFCKHSVTTVTKHIVMHCELPNTLNGTN